MKFIIFGIVFIIMGVIVAICTVHDYKHDLHNSPNLQAIPNIIADRNENLFYAVLCIIAGVCIIIFQYR